MITFQILFLNNFKSSLNACEQSIDSCLSFATLKVIFSTTNKEMALINVRQKINPSSFFNFSVSTLFMVYGITP